MTPLPANQVLDQYFLEARAKLLDLAAILDRIDRGTGGDTLNDPRLEQVNAAIKRLTDGDASRAASIQELFSLKYDPDWVRPAAKSPPAAAGGLSTTKR